MRRELTGWIKSSFCNGASSCVEVASLADGNVALRDGKDDDSAVLEFTPGEWAAFTAGVRDGEFDIATLAAVASGGDGPRGASGSSLADAGADSAPG